MNCGLVKLNPRWKAKKYKIFYISRYDSFYRGPQKSIRDLFEDDLKTKGKLMNERLGGLQLPKNIRMLDVGGGTGFSFYSIDSNTQVKSFIIEPSERLRPFLMEKGINIVEIDQAFSGEFVFDLIISRHTLEHTTDPINFLRKIRVSLTDEGFAYLVVPNSMFFNENKSHSFFRHVHTYYFNISTLSQMCNLAGFNILKVATGSNESSEKEPEIWAILGKKTNSSVTLKKISPKDQLEILLRYAPYSRLSPLRKIKAILKRILY